MKVCLRVTLFLAAIATVFGADKAPSWLTEIATREAPEYEADVSAVVLLQERRITVSANGSVLTAERGAVRILNRKGKSEAVARVIYRTDSGKVRELRAWVVYPSGAVKEFGKKDVVDVSLAENDVYNEVRVKAIVASRSADPGAVFGYESVEEDRSIFSQFSYQFQDELPVLTSRFALTLPAGWSAETVTFNHEEISAEVSGGTHTWQLDNLEPVVDEVARPPISSLAPRVAVSYFSPEAGERTSFRTWDEVAGWLAGLREPESEARAAVESKARELTEGAGTVMDKIRAVGEYAQDIRYVSIQTGIGRGGGYEPHPAADILENGYGDCKDKAHVMIEMLRSAGIDAYPVSVYSGDRHYVRREWPSPHQFNHRIVAVRLEEEIEYPAVGRTESFGTVLYFDPTDEYTRAGHLPEQLEGSLALIVDSEGGELVALPTSPPEANRLTRTVQVKMNGAGDIEAKVTEVCAGESGSSNRALFESLGADDYRKVIERWVSRGVRGAAVADVDVSESAGDDLKLELGFAAARYAQSMQGRLLMYRPVLLSRRGDLAFEDAERRYPTVLGSNTYSERTTYELPAGFAVDELPPPLALETEFGSYTAKTEVGEGKLTFVRELVVRPSVVPAEEYGSVREFFGKIQGLENSPVVLVRK